jgi:hypothetical protein
MGIDLVFINLDSKGDAPLEAAVKALGEVSLSSVPNVSRPSAYHLVDLWAYHHLTRIDF